MGKKREDTVDDLRSSNEEALELIRKQEKHPRQNNAPPPPRFRRQNQQALDSDEEDDKEYEVDDVQNNNSQGTQYHEIITKLLQKNKINSKNAFDVKIPNVRDIDEFQSNRLPAIALDWEYLSLSV